MMGGSNCIWSGCLNHWGRVRHICVGNLTIIGSDNGLSPGRRQAIIWTNAGILLIRTLGTNFNEILCEIHPFSFSKIHLKMSVWKMASIWSRPQWVNRPGQWSIEFEIYDDMSLESLPIKSALLILHGNTELLSTWQWSRSQFGWEYKVFSTVLWKIMDKLTDMMMLLIILHN